MVEYIIGQLIHIYEMVSGMSTNANIFKSLEEFSSGIFNGVNAIRESVVMPVALVILSLFLLLELYNIVVRFDSSHQLMGIELPLKVMFKAIIYKIVLEKSGVIMTAIFNLSLELTKSMQGFMGTTPNEIDLNITAFEKSLNKLGFWDSLFSALIVFLIGFIIQLIILAIQVLIISRFIEIYVLIAISPIPIATLPNSELGIGKNFLKNFAAVCIHGVFIYLILTIMPYLINEIVLKSIDGKDFMADLLKMLLCSAVMGVAVIGSSRWAKALCNAM